MEVAISSKFFQCLKNNNNSENNYFIIRRFSKKIKVSIFTTFFGKVSDFWYNIFFRKIRIFPKFFSIDSSDFFCQFENIFPKNLLFSEKKIFHKSLKNE